MWAIGLWGIAHVLANGDLAGLLAFGSLAFLALAGTLAIDARRSRVNPPGWGVFVQCTSNLPFKAVLDRRQRLVPGEIGRTRIAIALLIYVGTVWLHPWFIGVPAF